VAQFNFSGKEQEKKISTLSGGERNRVQLAKSLIKGCNVIILDEPTNDLDVDTLRKLEEALADFQQIGVVIIVSHDRWFLDRVCNQTLALEKSGPVIFDGTYSEYEQERGKPIHGDKKHKKLMES
jgi:ATPase subunit of ABC transporter with duplicated ATPase domains